jgi:hypothetical protein
MIELFGTVRLIAAQPHAGLDAGALGVVVESYTEPNLAYEVEFCNAQGETLASLTLTPDQITTTRQPNA